MNNVMQNEGEYVMQISALTSSLNVSKNISADLLSHFTVRSLHNSSFRFFYLNCILHLDQFSYLL